VIMMESTGPCPTPNTTAASTNHYPQDKLPEVAPDNSADCQTSSTEASAAARFTDAMPF
jgi:hypothetical protein